MVLKWLIPLLRFAGPATEQLQDFDLEESWSFADLSPETIGEWLHTV